MADLNQMAKRVRSGWDREFYLKLIDYCIKNYEEAIGDAPICCFYQCKVEEIDSEMILDGFRNYADSQKEWVIGCSRGCLLLEDIKRGKISYRERLCKECVKEAREVIKDES